MPLSFTGKITEIDQQTKTTRWIHNRLLIAAGIIGHLNALSQIRSALLAEMVRSQLLPRWPTSRSASCWRGIAVSVMIRFGLRLEAAAASGHDRIIDATDNVIDGKGFT